jgi:glycosyltransferase involved in cell wall biosynthesis
MGTPLVSVVIPAYNCARTLPATVASVLMQTVDDFEVVIVDDGSRDDTLAVARRIADPRVRALTRPNGGAAAARNTGIQASRGRYVALLDSDDLWLPQKLERQLLVLEGDRGVFAVQSGAVFVNDELKVLHVAPCEPSADPLVDALLFRNMPNTMSTLVIARNKFDEMGLFDTSLEILEEWDMIIKVARHCNLASLEEPLSLYRVHPGNRSRNLAIHIEPGHRVLGRLFADPSLPAHVRRLRRRVYAQFYTMLSGGSLRCGDWVGAVRWGLKGAVTNPSCLTYMAALPYRRLRRLASVRSLPQGYLPGADLLAKLHALTA